MKRYLKLFYRIMSLSLMRAMAYPDDFLTWAVVDIAWAIVNIGFFRILLFAIPEISGWTFEMLLIPLGLLYLLNAVIWGLLWSSLTQIPQDIVKGDLDMYLTKPANSQFLVSVRYIGINLLPSLIAGVFLLYFGIKANHLPMLSLLVIPVALLTASFISYAVWFMTVSLAFWFNRLLNVGSLFPHSVDIARYPANIFHPFFRFIFTFILPFALLGFLPAEVMLGKTSPDWLIMPIIIAAILLYFSHLFWNFSLRRYSSASS